jgi:MYXO-CTERM domain-containing protein
MLEARIFNDKTAFAICDTHDGCNFDVRTNCGPTASTTDRQDANAPTAARTDDAPRNDHNWGWIGLLWLAGLGGLAGRKRDVRDRDRDATNIRRAA